MLKIIGDKINNSQNKPKKLLNVPNKWLNSKKKALNRTKDIYKYSERAFDDASKGLLVKQITIGVLLDKASSDDLLFVRKGSQKYIPTLKRATAQSCGTSNGTFQMKRWV